MIGFRNFKNSNVLQYLSKQFLKNVRLCTFIFNFPIKVNCRKLDNFYRILQLFATKQNMFCSKHNVIILVQSNHCKFIPKRRLVVFCAVPGFMTILIHYICFSSRMRYLQNINFEKNDVCGNAEL